MLELLNLSVLGALHTLVSLIAMAAGIVALIRFKEITHRTLSGKIYIVTTVLTCLSGFGIYRLGGFGAPHVLGIVTLVVLGISGIAAKGIAFGRASRYIEVIGYSATLFFHTIPAITETVTRIPIGNPLITDRNSPALQAAAGVTFLLFLIGATLQFIRLRKAASSN